MSDSSLCQIKHGRLSKNFYEISWCQDLQLQLNNNSQRSQTGSPNAARKENSGTDNRRQAAPRKDLTEGQKREESARGNPFISQTSSDKKKTDQADKSNPFYDDLYPDKKKTDQAGKGNPFENDMKSELRQDSSSASPRMKTSTPVRQAGSSGQKSQSPKVPNQAAAQASTVPKPPQQNYRSDKANSDKQTASYSSTDQSPSSSKGAKKNANTDSASSGASDSKSKSTKSKDGKSLFARAKNAMAAKKKKKDSKQASASSDQKQKSSKSSSAASGANFDQNKPHSSRSYEEAKSSKPDLNSISNDKIPKSSDNQTSSSRDARSKLTGKQSSTSSTSPEPGSISTSVSADLNDDKSGSVNRTLSTADEASSLSSDKSSSSSAAGRLRKNGDDIGLEIGSKNKRLSTLNKSFSDLDLSQQKSPNGKSLKFDTKNSKNKKARRAKSLGNIKQVGQTFPIDLPRSRSASVPEHQTAELAKKLSKKIEKANSEQEKVSIMQMKLSELPTDESHKSVPQAVVICINRLAIALDNDCTIYNDSTLNAAKYVQSKMLDGLRKEYNSTMKVTADKVQFCPPRIVVAFLSELLNNLSSPVITPSIADQFQKVALPAFKSKHPIEKQQSVALHRFVDNLPKENKAMLRFVLQHMKSAVSSKSVSSKSITNFFAAAFIQVGRQNNVTLKILAKQCLCAIVLEELMKNI